MHNDPRNNYKFDGKTYGPVQMVLDSDDGLRPCPFCGRHKELELSCTWTPSYSIKCPCGAEMRGGGVNWRNDSEAHSLSKHKAAANRAIRKWNERVDSFPLIAK